MVIIALVVCFLLQATVQYYIFEEMKADLRLEIIRHVDTFMREVHFKSLREVNRIGMLSDAKKLDQIENIITRLEGLDRGDS